MERATTSTGPTNDTAAEAEAVLLECLRRLSPAERLLKGCAMSQRGRRAAMDAIRRHHPGADAEEVRLRFLELAYGPGLAADVRRWLRNRRG